MSDNLLETSLENVSTIEQVLKETNFFSTKTKGVSMLPFIKTGRDTVLIKRYEGRLNLFDVALFKTDEGKFILHRVIKVCDFGYYTRGDNCVNCEKVYENQVLGVLIGWYKNKKYISCDDKKYVKRVKFLLKHDKYRRFTNWFIQLPTRVVNKLKRIFKNK